MGKSMTEMDKDDLILEAALEYGPDYFYDIRYGTLGETLYVDAGTKQNASAVRKEMPLTYKGLYTIVLYHTEPK